MRTFCGTFIAAAGMALPLLGYVPEPQPVKSAVEITALYYPGTEQMSEWDMIAQTCPERKPLLGWFDEGNPEAIDWQIKWAVEHGISSFCVDWYWNKGFRRLEHWVKGYYKARYRNYLKWYIMYANHNQPGAHSTEDQIAVTKYWIDNYFKTPEYYKIDGKPVVCYWSFENLDRDFIAEAVARGEKLGIDAFEGVRRAFAISEKMVKEAGLPGIHWQIMWSSTAYDPVVTFGMRGVGVSSSISYGLVGDARILAPKAAAKAEGLTYDMVMEAMPILWRTKAVQQELPWWLPIPTGWDARPRSFSKAAVIRDRTPEKFAARRGRSATRTESATRSSTQSTNGRRGATSSRTRNMALRCTMPYAMRSARSPLLAGRRTSARPTSGSGPTTFRRSSARRCSAGTLRTLWKAGIASPTAAANWRRRTDASTSG